MFFQDLLKSLVEELNQSEPQPEKDPELSFYLMSAQEPVDPMPSSVQDRIRDAKLFLRTSLMGLKTVAWSVAHSHPIKSGISAQVSFSSFFLSFKLSFLD
jgi:hypothetical protein